MSGSMMPTVDVLAAARIVRLLRRDAIGDPARERFIAWAYGGQELHEAYATWQDQAALDPEAPRLAELIGCSWCLGVWTAAFVLVARRAAPRLWDPLARVLAASLVASVIELTTDRA